MSSPGPDADHRLQQLLERYGHVLRRAIARAAPRRSGVDVEDVEQEARLRVWNALQRQVDVEKPASYLYRVAWTAAVDAVRRVRARREEALPEGEEGTAGASSPGAEPGLAATPPRLRLVSSSPSPEDRAAQRQEVRRVEAALAGLSPNRRRAVGLYLQGFRSGEVADLLGWSEAKARNLVYRGLADLRRRLDEMDARDEEATPRHDPPDRREPDREPSAPDDAEPPRKETP